MYTEQCWQAYQGLQNTLQGQIDNQKSGALLLVSLDNLFSIMSAYDEVDVNHLMEHVRAAISAVALSYDENKEDIFWIRKDKAVLLISNSAQASLEKLLRDMHRAIEGYCGIKGQVEIHIIASTAIIQFPEHANDAKHLMDKLYISMRLAQENMLHHVSGTDAIEKLAKGTREKMKMACTFKRAMEEKKVKLAFQPIISSKNGKVFCYEALLRIVTKEKELISAGPYIGVAEEFEFISTVDLMVFRMVCQELEASPEVTLSFNVSNQTIDSHEWLREAENMLKDREDIASRMIVEITETGVQRSINKATDFVITLQALGCQVALDDFGAGYTSFRQLNRLPIDIVKIDGTFIRNMLNNHESHNFVKTLLDFTSSCGLKTVAEFVENGEITKELMGLNVDYLQGHYFGEATDARPWKG